MLGCHTKRNNQQTSSLSRSCLFEWRTYIAWNNYHVARSGQPSAPCRWQDGRRDIFGSVGQRHTLIIGYSWEWNRGGHKFDPLSILMQPRDARDKFFPSIYHIRTAARCNTTRGGDVLSAIKLPARLAMEHRLKSPKWYLCSVNINKKPAGCFGIIERVAQ